MFCFLTEKETPWRPRLIRGPTLRKPTVSACLGPCYCCVHRCRVSRSWRRACWRASARSIVPCMGWAAAAAAAASHASPCAPSKPEPRTASTRDPGHSTRTQLGTSDATADTGKPVCMLLSVHGRLLFISFRCCCCCYKARTFNPLAFLIGRDRKRSLPL